MAPKFFSKRSFLTHISVSFLFLSDIAPKFPYNSLRLILKYIGFTLTKNYMGPSTPRILKTLLFPSQPSPLLLCINYQNSFSFSLPWIRGSHTPGQESKGLSLTHIMKHQYQHEVQLTSHLNMESLTSYLWLKTKQLSIDILSPWKQSLRVSMNRSKWVKYPRETFLTLQKESLIYSHYRALN